MALCEVANIIGGGTPDTSNPLYWNGDIDWFTPTEVGESKYVNESKRKITYAGLKSSSAKLLPRGSILLSTRASVGLASITTNPQGVTTNQGFQSVVPKRVEDSEFLYYVISNQNTQRELKTKANGSTFPEISNSEVSSIIVSLPPDLKERFEISRFLATIDQRIRLQNKIIEERESSMRTLFLSLDSGTKEQVRLCDLGECMTCGSLSWNDIGSEGKPVIIYGELFTSYRYLIDAVPSKTQRNLKSISVGRDLLFPSSTTVDAVSLISPAVLLRPGVALGGDMFDIVVKNEIDPIYLSFLINCRYKKALSKYAQGSTIIHLHYEDIRCFPLELVPFQKQKSIGKVMASYLKAVEIEKEKLSLLLKQKEYLLKNLFI